MTSNPCDDMALLVQADLDGELSAAEAAALAAHTATCATCAALQADLGRLSGRLRTELPRYKAPPSILVQAPRRAQVSWRDGRWFGAGLALAASVALLMLPRKPAPETDVVAAHIRALQPGHLLDVTSTDRHTVKPWFDGKLDFAPPVNDFAAQGYPLVGGRLDYLAGRPVAALVYGRDKHLIDVFIWPGDQPSSSQTEQGYNVLAWSKDSMNFRAVSDLNSGELGDLKGLLLKAK